MLRFEQNNTSMWQISDFSAEGILFQDCFDSFLLEHQHQRNFDPSYFYLQKFDSSSSKVQFQESEFRLCNDSDDKFPVL